MSTNPSVELSRARGLRSLAREATIAVVAIAVILAFWPLLGAPARAWSVPAGAVDADELSEIDLALAPRPAGGERLGAAIAWLERVLVPSDLRTLDFSSYYPDLALHLAGSLLLARLAAAMAGAWSFGLAVGLVYATHPVLLATIGDLDGRSRALAALAVMGALAAHVQAGARATGGSAWRALALALAATAALEHAVAALAIGPLWWMWDRVFRPAARAHRALPIAALAIALVGLAHDLATGRAAPPVRLADGPLLFGQVLVLAVRPDRFPVGMDVAPPAWSVGAALPWVVALGLVGGLAHLVRRTDCTSAKIALFGAVWALLGWAGEAGLVARATARLDGTQLAPAVAGLALVALGGLSRAAGSRAGWIVPGAALAVALVLGSHAQLHAHAYTSAVAVHDAALARDAGRNYRVALAQSLAHWWTCATEIDARRVKDELVRSLAALDRARGLSDVAGDPAPPELLALQRARILLAQAALVPDGYGATAEVERLVALAQQELAAARTDSATPGAQRREGLRRALEGEAWAQRAMVAERGAAPALLAQARRAFEDARAHEPSALALVALASLELASLEAELVHLARDPSPGPFSGRTVLLATVIASRGARVTAAEALLDQALARYPDATSALTQKAVLAYHERRAPAQALELFARALGHARSPRARMEVHRRVGRLRMAQGELGQAEQSWESVLAIDGADLEALRSLSDICAADRRWQKALNYLSRLIAHHKHSARPEVKDARARLAELHRELGNYLYKQTLEVIKGRRTPPSAEPVDTDELLESLNDPEIQARMIEATVEFDKALDADPTDPGARFRKAEMLFLDASSELRLGHLEKGLEILIPLVTQFPEFEVASEQILAIAAVMEQRGNLEHCFKLLDDAHKSNEMSVLLRNLRNTVKLKLDIRNHEPELLRRAQRQIDLGLGDHKDHWVVAKHAIEAGAHEKAFAHATTAITLCPDTKQRDQFRKELAGHLIRWGKTAHGRLRAETEPERLYAALADHPPWWIPARVFRAALKDCFAQKLAVVWRYLSRAHDLLRPLYDADPTNSDLANNLALVYQLTNQPDQAIAVLDTVEKPPPHVRQLLAELLFKRAALGGDDVVEGASLATQVKTLKSQVADLERAQSLLGDAAPEKLAKALVARRFVLERALGVVAAGEGRFEDAVAHLERARAANELDFVTNYHLGLALVKLGRDDSAAERLELARARRPKEVGVLVALADLYFRRGGADLARAYRIYGQFLDEMDAANPQLTTLYADTIARARTRQDELIARYRAHYEAGTAHLEARRYREGADELARALEIRPEATDVRHQRALALLSLADGAGAKAELLRVRREWPDDPFVPWRLARAHGLLGEVAPARALLEQVLATQGASAELVRQARADLDALPK